MSDNGVSSWNEYALTGREAFTPLFLDANSVTSAKYLEAIREGVQDYESLAMLGDAIEAAKARGADAALVTEAQHLLEGIAGEVLAKAGASIQWSLPLDRNVADVARTSILDMMVRLSP